MTPGDKVRAWNLFAGLVLAGVSCQSTSRDAATSDRPGDTPLLTPAGVEFEPSLKLSQYDEAITSSHGRSACGLFALATTLGAVRSQESLRIEIDRLRAIADEEGSYDNGAGIQPASLLSLAQRAYPDWTVEACSDLTLSNLRQALGDGHGVIVDIQVGVAFPDGEFPSSTHPNLAHFARVLAIDYREPERRIILENSLRGGPSWELSIDDFLAVWKHPETAVSIRPGQRHPNPKLHPQDVSHWALIASRQAVNICDGRQGDTVER